MDNENKIVLNIGGTRFETNKTTLKKIPATRLSRLTEALGNYDSILNEYFFDRHPGVFAQILNYYRTGKLHYPNNVCGPLFETELEFWGLDSNQVEPCCWKTYTKHRDTQETLATLEKLALDDDSTTAEELAQKFRFDDDPRWHRGTLPFYKRIQPIIWQLFEEPRSSTLAKIIGRISILFIILSILSYCLSTVDGFCPFESLCRSHKLQLYILNDKKIQKSIINVSAIVNQSKITLLDYIEYVCIAWFTLELTIRFLVSPKRIEFCKNPLNWIDFLANLWFYVDFLVYQLLNTSSTNQNISHPAWDLLGTIRIMRLFKFINHHKGLKIIIASLKASASILRLLVFFVCVAIIIFASLIFYCERLATHAGSTIKINPRVSTGSVYNKNMRDNDFTSIVEAIWFSIISLTTVGFGDYVPRTPFGMVFGALCTVTGVLMIDLPMPIIVQNFANYYNHLQARSKLPKKLRRKLLCVNTTTPAPVRMSVTRNSQQNYMAMTTIVHTTQKKFHTINETTQLIQSPRNSISKSKSIGTYEIVRNSGSFPIGNRPISANH